jgi:hypothetical protein
MKEPFTDGLQLFHLDDRGKVLSSIQIERWKGLSVALRKRGENIAALQADRIANQLLFTTAAFEWLLSAYRSTLTEKFQFSDLSDVAEGNFHFTSDKYAAQIGYRVQACLNELFALRDFILKFVFSYLYRGDHYNWSNLRRLLETSDDFKLASLLLPAMSRDTISRFRGRGWDAFTRFAQRKRFWDKSLI